jgi:hypothetical protein
MHGACLHVPAMEEALIEENPVADARVDGSGSGLMERWEQRVDVSGSARIALLGHGGLGVQVCGRLGLEVAIVRRAFQRVWLARRIGLCREQLESQVCEKREALSQAHDGGVGARCRRTCDPGSTCSAPTSAGSEWSCR